MKELNSCSIGHDRIFYKTQNCPLCRCHKAIKDFLKGKDAVIGLLAGNELLMDIPWNEGNLPTGRTKPGDTKKFINLLKYFSELSPVKI